MPVYEYQCRDCEKIFEVQQKMIDPPLTVCPECDGSLKKLISASSFQLKGGGWYADGYASTSGGAKTSSAASCPATSGSGESCKSCPASSTSSATASS